MHWSLIPDRTGPLDDGLPRPPVPIIDIHMHSASPEATAAYVRAAKQYGVVAACNMEFDGVPSAMRAEFGDFFHPCGWPRPEKTVDWDRFRAEWIEGLDRLIEAGMRAIKLKSEPSRGRPGVWLDDDRLRPLFEACAQRGILVQAHLAQPSRWWPDRYEPGRCGPKAIYLEQMERVLERTPGLPYLGVHFGGCPEEPGYVADLMAAHPGYHVDTSATKWVVRELSARRDEAREVFLRFPDRICFGSDLVVQEGVDFDYYTSRFHVQRTMWETGGRGLSMIADPDAPAGGPHLCGLDLPQTVLGKLYRENAARLLGLTAG